MPLPNPTSMQNLIQNSPLYFGQLKEVKTMRRMLFNQSFSSVLTVCTKKDYHKHYYCSWKMSTEMAKEKVIVVTDK
jgi:hypothetical protein